MNEVMHLRLCAGIKQGSIFQAIVIGICSLQDKGRFIHSTEEIVRQMDFLNGKRISIERENDLSKTHFVESQIS